VVNDDLVSAIGPKGRLNCRGDSPASLNVSQDSSILRVVAAKQEVSCTVSGGGGGGNMPGREMGGSEEKEKKGKEKEKEKEEALTYCSLV
jgi:hypothetical protein